MDRAEARVAAIIAGCVAATVGAIAVIPHRPDVASFEIEPSLAVTAGGELAVAFMQGTAGPADGIGVRLSSDGGVTWATTALVRSPGGRFAADPVIVAEGDSFSLVWLGFRQNVAARGAPYDVRVYVERGLGFAGGSSGAARPRNDIAEGEGGESYDRPAAVAGGGVLSIAFRFESASRRGVAVARSEGGGPFVRTDVAAGDGALPQLCGSADGARLYLTFVDPAVGVVLRASDDGGATWRARALVVAPADAALAFEAAPCAAHGDELWIAYGQAARAMDGASSAVLSSIVVAHSSDAGRTLDRDADSVVPPDGRLLMHPTLAAHPDGGGVFLGYYEGSEAAGAAFVMRAPRSGTTALAYALRFVPRRDAAGWPGDYAAIAAFPGHSHAAFVDNRSAPRVEIRQLDAAWRWSTDATRF